MPNRSAASGNPEKAISRTVFRAFRSSLCERRCCLTKVTRMRVSPASLCASFVDGGNSGSPFIVHSGCHRWRFAAIGRRHTYPGG
jgi:hypothetical protein